MPIRATAIFYLEALYWITSPRRFDILFWVADDSYHEFKEVYEIKITHLKYYEAMRRYEENARDSFAATLKEEIRFHGNYGKYALIRIALTSILFMPSLQYFVLGLVGIVLVITAHSLIKFRLNGNYIFFPAVILADRAYRATYNKPLF